MSNTSSYTVWHTRFKEKIQASYLTMLVTVFKIPKGSNTDAFWLWKASWWLTIKIKTPLRSTMCNWRDDKNKPLRVAAKFFTKQNEVSPFPPRYLPYGKKGQTSWKRHCVRSVMHKKCHITAYHWGGKIHTQSSMHTLTETNQQKSKKFVCGGVLCKNHPISGKIKQTRFT